MGFRVTLSSLRSVTERYDLVDVMPKAKEVLRQPGSPFDDVKLGWAVEVAGHRWVDDCRCIDQKPDRVITGISDEEKPELRIYPMSEVPGLFRTFAKLEPSEAVFVKFADKYGTLGLDHVPVQGGHKNAVGERWWDWFVAQREFASAVRLWDAIQDGDVSEFLHGTRRQEGWTAWEFRLDDQESLTVPMNLHESHPHDAARRFIQSWINEGLAERVVSRVLWHPDRRKYVAGVVPIKLIGFMWWQFARMFTGETRFTECLACQKPIEHGPDGSFITRRFCNDACRQRHHRERVKQAKELKAKDWSLKEIAKELGTDTKTIKNWLHQPE